MRIEELQFERGSFRLGPLSHDFGPSRVTAVVGKNGSGKSTLLKILAGRLKAKSGRIYGAADRIASCGVEPLFPLSWSTQEAADWFYALSESKSKAWRFDLPFSKDRSLQTLSTGQRRLAELGIVLSIPLSCFLLDEPFQNLDSDFRTIAETWVHRRAQEGASVILTGHHSQEWASGLIRVEGWISL
jgi:ABC-type multidrug transport system ATPase subunit